MYRSDLNKYTKNLSNKYFILVDGVYRLEPLYLLSRQIRSQLLRAEPGKPKLASENLEYVTGLDMRTAGPGLSDDRERETPLYYPTLTLLLDG